MPKPSLDTLRTPANGQIFTLAQPLTKSAVGRLFDAAAAKASGRKVVHATREKRSVDGTDFFASLVHFPLSGPPPFFPESALVEQTYGFLLAIEMEVGGEWFLGVFKHGAASIVDWLEDTCEPLSRTKLAHAFSDGTTVGKISLQRMTASKHELRNASFEAADLQTSLPMLAANRCVIRSLRFNDDIFGSVSVTLSTARVQRAGGRSSIDELAELVEVVAEETQAAKNHPFLETFAQEIRISDLPAGTEPNSILFDWCDLLENGALELCRAAPAGGVARKEPKKALLPRLLGHPVAVMPDGAGWQFADDPAHALGVIARTTTKFSVRSVLNNKYCVRDTRTDEKMPLAKWARENDAYRITFSSPDYFFGSGALYFRAGFAKEVALVRQCLRAEAALVGAITEKGKPLPAPGHSCFAANCIFGVVENTLYAAHDWLCCADLNDEWADYLCIRGTSLTFIHCKGGAVTKGASCFQEVIGQALKNLGRIRSTPAEFDTKIKGSWRQRCWRGTKIKRLRGAGGTWKDFHRALSALLANPDGTREVHLVVNMLSLADYDGVDPAHPTPHFLQLVWLLSSFINSCREVGAKPMVICRP